MELRELLLVLSGELLVSVGAWLSQRLAGLGLLQLLELLLQLWQCTSMRDALVVGSWSDDLRSVCGHLVRGDVHPQLAELALPAKILQNALG